jgi:hypothetical protein
MVPLVRLVEAEVVTPVEVFRVVVDAVIGTEVDVIWSVGRGGVSSRLRRSVGKTRNVSSERGQI